MPQVFNDNARALLAGTINAAATSLSVEAGKADRFPVATTSNWSTPLNWFKATLFDNAGNREVIYVGQRTAGNGALSNVQRGMDGTTALSWNAGAATVVHGPMASDFQKVLAGIVPQLTITNGTVAGGFRLNAGILTVSQMDASGNVLSDRFIFDQTTGILTASDLALTSDERLKSGWRSMGRHFIQKLSKVKRGTYRRKGSGRREVGVSAQSLREAIPQAVHHEAKDGMLSVSYGQAALVAAIELAADNCDLRAELAGLKERIKRLERRK